MRTIAVAVAVLLCAVPVAAQRTEPDHDRQRVTVGVSTQHFLTVIGGYESNPLPFGLHVGWRATDRIGLQADIVQYRESLGFDEEVRTLRWWTGATVFHFNDRGPLRPHLFAGGELLIDSTNHCALIRRDYPGEHCDDFPHRRGGVNGGLGVDIPFGRRFFARIQYVTSAIYVYEQIAISHKARLVAGIRF